MNRSTPPVAHFHNEAIGLGLGKQVLAGPQGMQDIPLWNFPAPNKCWSASGGQEHVAVALEATTSSQSPELLFFLESPKAA